LKQMVQILGRGRAFQCGRFFGKAKILYSCNVSVSVWLGASCRALPKLHSS